jgi:hypothetical protein
VRGAMHQIAAFFQKQNNWPKVMFMGEKKNSTALKEVNINHSSEFMLQHGEF